MTGNSDTIFLETPYKRMQEWVANMPKEGLIRYYIVGNLERVVLTSPKALSELLVTKVYDFEKPQTVRQSLRRIVGDGILLAEGEEHKVVFMAITNRIAFILIPLGYAASTQKLDACICVPPHQRPLPNFLVQECRNGQADPAGSGKAKGLWR